MCAAKSCSSSLLPRSDGLRSSAIVAAFEDFGRAGGAAERSPERITRTAKNLRRSIS
jgi:hypothetical protein